MSAAGSPFNIVLFTKVCVLRKGIFKGRETSAEKCLYVNDLALFYSARATAIIEYKMQGTIDTPVENPNSIGYSLSGYKMGYLLKIIPTNYYILLLLLYKENIPTYFCLLF